MGQHWIKDIIDNKNAVSGEAEALSNHKERLDALDEKVAKLEESGVDTSNYVTLTGSQTITGAKTFSSTFTTNGDTKLGAAYPSDYIEVDGRESITTVSGGNDVNILAQVINIGTDNTSRIVLVTKSSDNSTATLNGSPIVTKDDISTLENTIAELQERIAALENK